MPNDLAHFAITADDCERAKRFYETVFNWALEPWGPPEFWLIHTSPNALVKGALQKRREPNEGGGRLIGFECTIGVDDVHAVRKAVEAAGGTILTPPVTIEHVGIMIRFADTEGNVVGAMQYEDGVR